MQPPLPPGSAVITVHLQAFKINNLSRRNVNILVKPSRDIVVWSMCEVRYCQLIKQKIKRDFNFIHSA